MKKLSKFKRNHVNIVLSKKGIIDNSFVYAAYKNVYKFNPSFIVKQGSFILGEFTELLLTRPTDVVLWEYPEANMPLGSLIDLCDVFKQRIDRNTFIIYTHSLFLLREIDIQEIPNNVINIDTGLHGHIDDVGEIDLLTIDLEQSDRYLEKNNE